MNRLNLKNRVFGRLIAISPHRTSSGLCGWLCRCSCGREIIVRTADLTKGHTKSCGCLRLDRTSTHKLSNSPVYDIWVSMIRRCTNPKCKNYRLYGGRGITVCDEWLQFPPFHKWMLEQGYTRGLSIDRIDNDKGYCPENCRVTTMRVQQQNRRNSITVEYKNERKALIEFSRTFNIPYQTMYYRHKHNLDIVTGGIL